MASSSSSPSVAFSSQSWKYHVFLSFRGEDTRRNFVDHLYSALEQQGIYTYKDDETLPRGESIGPSLMKAIEESQIAVIIFSENYADSSWCLDELACIMKCKDMKGQIVMPIFYGVDPSEVRKQKLKYGEAFVKHELENKKKIKSWGQSCLECLGDPCGWLFAPQEQIRKTREALAKHEVENKAKVESWRKALVDASNISGWEPKYVANGHESRVIKEIVDTISRRSQLVHSSANDNLIGMADRVLRLKSKLGIGSGGVRMIGIWGVGGGGKTTLASSIYDEISGKFGGSCFVENVRGESGKNGLVSLQKKMLSSILKQKEAQMTERVAVGRRMIIDRLCHRKVLIVLDDVDHVDQLEALVGSHDWFGEGSRIIITTRDEHVLNVHSINVTHNISLLNSDEAIKLFRKHAHMDCTPTEDYEQLSKEVVSYAGGLPLALVVLGSFLCDKNINEWRSALARLKEIPNDNILETLKISFDGLTKVEKELFLDIACFFRWGNKKKTMEILDACGFHPVIGVKVLIQKALITITEDGEFDMHDLVQEMGHHIVRREWPNNPEKHSRIWKEEDALKICAIDATMELVKTEAIKVNFWFQPGKKQEQDLIPSAVANMKNLRYMEITCPPAKSLFNDLPPRELCCLILSGGLQKQLWEGCKLLPSLKILKLYSMNYLIMTPDFNGLPNLERFTLQGCHCLKEIDPSIGCLEKLVFLCIKACSSLEMFPPIWGLMKLETLLFPAHLMELFKFPNIQQQKMENLPHLDLDNSGNEVASYIEYCPNFCVICGMCGCSNIPGVCLNINLGFFHNLQELGFLRKLDLGWSNLGDEDIGSDVLEFPNLQELDLAHNKFSKLSFSFLRLPCLKCLDVSGCKKLVELSDLPASIAVVTAEECKSLETFGDISNCKWLWKVSLNQSYKVYPRYGGILLNSMLQGNAIEDHFISVNLEHQIPEGFVGRFFMGKTFTMRCYLEYHVRPASYTFKLRLPDDWCNDFCGFLIRVVTSNVGIGTDVIIKKDVEEEDSLFELWQESNEAPEPKYGGDARTYVGYVSFSSLRKTTSFNSSYNIISFSIHDTHWTSFAAELVPRKSKDEPLQTTKLTTDSSEFWDGARDYYENFEINQNSESSVKIIWRPDDPQP